MRIALLVTTLPILVQGLLLPSPPTSLTIRHEHEHHHIEAENHHPANTAWAKVTPEEEATVHHGHNHGSHAAAKEVLNDTEIHYWHDFPPSYLAADFRLTQDSAIFGDELPNDWNVEKEGGKGWLMVLHVLGMCGAYFGALPLSLALRAANHPLHFLANGIFLLLALTGWLFGKIYKSSTPNRYEGEAHSGMGNFLLLVSIGLGLLDSTGLLQQTIKWYRTSRKDQRNIKGFLGYVCQGRGLESSGGEYELVDNQEIVRVSEEAEERVVFSIDEEALYRRPGLVNTSHALNASVPARDSPTRSSAGSEGTLHDHTPSSGQSISFKSVRRSGAYEQTQADRNTDWQISLLPKVTKTMSLARFGEICLTWIRRSQVVFAWVVLLSGLSIYTGMCRASFLPGCAAHFIKGSIFFWYGLFGFARYVGAYADMGWAWNLAPASYTGPNFEMIECGLVFTYGITNTWMERFGAKAGDPYTVKQVQHISIAVMFWFAGLTGMLLESKRVRKILASIVLGKHDKNAEPPSYAFSFNPLPALVIGVTGLAMSAHHQDYRFQVEIHSLWGTLLAGAALFRWFTYFFLWLKPPTDSHLPSRPPTEIIAAFGTAAGGIVFILSDEEIAFAAMRAGYDDMMAFLNFTIALIGMVFCWVLIVLAVKGYAVMRLKRSAL